MDASQAFVQAPLEEEICQYGLKQAGRERHLLLVKWLVGVMDLEQCKAEPCVFRRLVNGKVEMMVGVQHR